MSAITINNDLVHYEVLGRGRPVILLHSWLGSWRYWMAAMRQLSMKYRVYALDLWGYGDSGKKPEHFSMVAQVDMLGQFMDKMGMTKAALVGHALGAAVVAHYAATHADRVPRLMVIAPPLFSMAPLPGRAGAAPSRPQLASGPESAMGTEDATIVTLEDDKRALLRDELERRAREIGRSRLGTDNPASGGKSPQEAALEPPSGLTTHELVSAPRHAGAGAGAGAPGTNRPGGEIDLQRPNPLKAHLGTLDRDALFDKYGGSGAVREALAPEVQKSAPNVIEKNVESYVQVNTLAELERLAAPKLLVFGTRDSFMPVPDGATLNRLQTGGGPFREVEMPDVGHFPMLEQEPQFTRLLQAFLEEKDITKLDKERLKKLWDTWERRIR